MPTPFFKPERLKNQVKVATSLGAHSESMFLATLAAIMDQLLVSPGNHHESLANKLVETYTHFFSENKHLPLSTATQYIQQQMRTSGSLRLTYVSQYVYCLRQILFQELNKAYYYPLSLLENINIEDAHKPGTFLNYFFLEALAKALNITIRIDLSTNETVLPVIYNPKASLSIQLTLKHGYYSTMLANPGLAEVQHPLDLSYPVNDQGVKLKEKFATIEAHFLAEFVEAQNRLSMMYKTHEKGMKELRDDYIAGLNYQTPKFAGLTTEADWISNALQAKYPGLSNTAVDEPRAQKFIYDFAMRMALGVINPRAVYGDEEQPKIYNL